MKSMHILNELAQTSVCPPVADCTWSGGRGAFCFLVQTAGLFSSAYTTTTAADVLNHFTCVYCHRDVFLPLWHFSTSLIED
jgi:hypothetical protein